MKQLFFLSLHSISPAHNAAAAADDDDIRRLAKTHNFHVNVLLSRSHPHSSFALSFSFHGNESIYILISFCLCIS